ncbi:MAG: hypothetical protein R2727_09550 [Bacteroidales bacterium]
MLCSPGNIFSRVASSLIRISYLIRNYRLIKHIVIFVYCFSISLFRNSTLSAACSFLAKTNINGQFHTAHGTAFTAFSSIIKLLVVIGLLVTISPLQPGQNVLVT